MRVLIAATYKPFEKALSVRLACDLQKQLSERGLKVDTLLLPYSPKPQRAIEQLLAFRLLDLSDFSGEKIDRLVTIGSPAMAFQHAHKNAWLLNERPSLDSPAESQRADVANEDGSGVKKIFLLECRNVFTASRAGAKNLLAKCGIQAAEVLYPPAPAGHPYRSGAFGEYIVVANPFESVQQTEIVLTAMSFLQTPVRLMLPPGEGPADVHLKQRIQEMRLEDKVCFSKGQSDETQADLIAESCGGFCLSLTREQDLETVFPFLFSAKPFIIASYFGDPCELIQHDRNGLIVSANPRNIAEAFDRLYRDRQLAAQMGAASALVLKEQRIDWEHVIGSILA